MKSPRRPSSGVVASIASLLLVSVVSCTTAPRLTPSVASARIRDEIYTGMTKPEVLRVVGEAERRELASLMLGDVSWRTEAGGNRPGECWLWGGDRMKPDAIICFSGLSPTVFHKSP